MEYNEPPPILLPEPTEINPAEASVSSPQKQVEKTKEEEQDESEIEFDDKIFMGDDKEEWEEVDWLE